MAFQVGSLANLISGIKSPNASKETKLFDSYTGDKKAVKINFETLDHVKKSKKKRKTDIGNFTVEPIKKQKISNQSKSNNEDSGTETSPAKNAIKRIKRKKKFKLENQKAIKEHKDRSVFVGNVPHDISKKKLKKFFATYGTVETVRLRGASLADPRVPKKVAVITKQLHPERNSINAYIRFADIESAKKAVAANGTILNEHHIRVDMAAGSKADYDIKKAVFLGNVPFSAEEDEIWKMFESCGSIGSIRIIRDNKTGVGKGFAYINFESTDAVELALKLDGEELKKRKLRVKRCLRKPPKAPDSKIKNQNLKKRSREFQNSDLKLEDNKQPEKMVQKEENEEGSDESKSDDDEDDPSNEVRKIHKSSGQEGFKVQSQKVEENRKNMKGLKLKFKGKKLNVQKPLKKTSKILNNRNEQQSLKKKVKVSKQSKKLVREEKEEGTDDKPKESAKKSKEISNFQGHKVSENKKSGKKKKKKVNKSDMKKKAMILKLNPKSKLPIKKAKKSILKTKSLAKKMKFKPSKI